MACWILLAIKFIWQAKYLLKDTLTKISINNSVSLTILSDGTFYDNNFVFYWVMNQWFLESSVYFFQPKNESNQMIQMVPLFCFGLMMCAQLCYNLLCFHIKCQMWWVFGYPVIYFAKLQNILYVIWLLPSPIIQNTSCWSSTFIWNHFV